jgi:aspartate 1-decarboxylase
MIEVLKSKIHGATVTKANLDYEGSITIDSKLMRAAEIIEFEKVQVLNINNGNRIETYVIKGEEGKGEICLNGAAARCYEGDKVIIISYMSIQRNECPDPNKTEY